MFFFQELSVLTRESLSTLSLCTIRVQTSRKPLLEITIHRCYPAGPRTLLPLHEHVKKPAHHAGAVCSIPVKYQ